jgi:hypothetical protein
VVDLHDGRADRVNGADDGTRIGVKQIRVVRWDTLRRFRPLDSKRGRIEKGAVPLFRSVGQEKGYGPFSALRSGLAGAGKPEGWRHVLRPAKDEAGVIRRPHINCVM